MYHFPAQMRVCSVNYVRTSGQMLFSNTTVISTYKIFPIPFHNNRISLIFDDDDNHTNNIPSFYIINKHTHTHTRTYKYVYIYIIILLTVNSMQ